jgi:hypothetical protein
VEVIEDGEVEIGDLLPFTDKSGSRRGGQISMTRVVDAVGRCCGDLV